MRCLTSAANIARSFRAANRRAILTLSLETALKLVRVGALGVSFMATGHKACLVGEVHLHIKYVLTWNLLATD